MSGGHAALYPCTISHLRTAVRRYRRRLRFSYGSYLWLVDLDQMPRLPLPAASARQLPSARPSRRSGRAVHQGERRRVPQAPRHRPGGGRVLMLAERAGARPRVQPAQRLLVLPARWRARGGARRGAQHLRAAARLPAATGRSAAGRAASKEFYVSPFLPVGGPVPAEPAGAGERLSLAVTLLLDGEPVLVASVAGQAAAVHGAAAARLLGCATRGHRCGSRCSSAGRPSSCSRAGCPCCPGHAPGYRRRECGDYSDD